MKPMLAHEASLEKVNELIYSNNWVFEPKYDGRRLLVNLGHGEILPKSRSGKFMKITHDLWKQLETFASMEMDLDGELVGDNYYVFDVPSIGWLPWRERRRLLEHLALKLPSGGSIFVTPSAFETLAKKNLLEGLKKSRGEGIVMKRKEAEYQSTRSHDWLKYKFYKTLEAVVIGLHVDGKENCELGLFDSRGNIIPVGKCSLVGKEPINLGDVVEVKYLYASSKDRLVQPTLLSKRTDKGLKDLTLDQLVYTTTQQGEIPNGNR